MTSPWPWWVIVPGVPSKERENWGWPFATRRLKSDKTILLMATNVTLQEMMMLRRTPQMLKTK